MKRIILIILNMATLSCFAQVGVYNNSPDALLDVSAVNGVNPGSDEGVLIPRLTSFPATNPGIAQNYMLIYMDNATAPFGKGFYYWDNTAGAWQNIGASVWGPGTNAATDPLIYPVSSSVTDVVVKDNGFVGFGTNNADSELHIRSDKSKTSPNINPDFIIENTLDDVALNLKPGGVGSSNYMLSAKSSVSEGLKIYENATEEIQIKQGGDFRVDNLEATQNLNIVYPAALYAESDGTIQVATPYSRLDELKVNEKNFSSLEMCETITSNGEVFSTSFYTYTTTPTQDVLLEISYHVGATISAFGGGVANNVQHNTKVYGVVLRLNGVDYTTMRERMVTNKGLSGYFHMSDHVFMPLVADGTTYTITLHGLVQNDVETKVGIRGDFGGNPDDRIQIREKL